MVDGEGPANGSGGRHKRGQILGGYNECAKDILRKSRTFKTRLDSRARPSLTFTELGSRVEIQIIFPIGFKKSFVI